MAAAASLGWAVPAGAQVGANLTLQSDYRYRGRSISDGRAAVTLNVAYDDRSGVYLGGNVTAAKTYDEGVEVVRSVTYIGYAVRPQRGPAFDVGVSSYHALDYRGARRTFTYAEVYGGVLTDHVSLRVHYAPDYYETGVETLYADLAGVIRPRPDVRVFAHVGKLAKVGGRGRGPWRDRYDVSFGVAKQFANCEISATWTRIDPQVVFANGRREKRDALVLAASYAF